VDESARQKAIVAWPVDECRRLSKAEGSNSYLRKGESGLADAKTLNAALGERVETLLQQLKTTRFVLGGMRKCVVRCLAHSQNRRLRYSPSSDLNRRLLHLCP